MHEGGVTYGGMVFIPRFVNRLKFIRGEGEAQTHRHGIIRLSSRTKQGKADYEINAAIMQEGVSKSFRIESITKSPSSTINTCSESTQRVMAAKLNRLTHKIVMQLNLVAENCTICSSSSRRPVRKLLDTAS
jgi:hypothetical protein